jgi:hypothetical protein
MNALRRGCCSNEGRPRSRHPAIFSSNLNLISSVQPSAQKYSSSVFQKSMVLSAHPDSIRGAARDRHGRGKQDAVDVRVLSAFVRADDNSFTDGEGAWS